MSETSSECTNPESFELINDVTNNYQDRLSLSNTPSCASTEFVDDINDLEDELKMDQQINIQHDMDDSSVANQTIQNLDNLNQDLLGKTSTSAETLQDTVNQPNVVPDTTGSIDQTVGQPPIDHSNANTAGDNANGVKVITDEIEQITFSKPEVPKNIKNQLVPVNPLTSSLTGGLFGWFTDNDFLHRFAEKAMNSVDTVITTLDPGMKEVLYSGGDINVLVTCGNESIVTGVRDAFLDVFKRATVKGIESQPQLAVQLVGSESAKQAASLRLSKLRENISVVPQNQVILIMESFVEEKFPDRWFEFTYLLLDDPFNQLQAITFSQATPVETDFINYLKFETPADYEHKSYGYAVPVGHLINERLNWNDPDWHLNYAGIAWNHIIYNAVVSLAHQYKNKMKSLGRIRL